MRVYAPSSSRFTRSCANRTSSAALAGEEFVVILSSADAAAADPIAHRILERVAGSAWMVMVNRFA